MSVYFQILELLKKIASIFIYLNHPNNYSKKNNLIFFARNCTKSMSVAACFTGLLRTLTHPLIKWSFNYFAKSRWKSTDIFISLSYISVKKSSLILVEKKLNEMYSPIKISWTNTEEQIKDILNNTCDSKFPSNPITHRWFANKQCYDDIIVEERRTGVLYSWIFLTRTDIILLSPIILPIEKTFAYLPFGGMTPYPAYKCMNDHIFLCPRQLCVPYFMMTNIWKSPGCNIQNFNIYSRNFKHTSMLHHIGSSRLPSKKPRRYPSQMVIFSLYADKNKPCNTKCSLMNKRGLCDEFKETYNEKFIDGEPIKNRNHSCCGLLRELKWRYVIMRDITGSSMSPIVSNAISDKILNSQECKNSNMIIANGECQMRLIKTWRGNNVHDIETLNQPYVDFCNGLRHLICK